jgi:hypothetical protein
MPLPSRPFFRIHLEWLEKGPVVATVVALLEGHHVGDDDRNVTMSISNGPANVEHGVGQVMWANEIQGHESRKCGAATGLQRNRLVGI